jgi:hypothetical protein
MLEDYFRYFKDCESWQKVKDVQLMSAAMLRPSLSEGCFVIGVYTSLGNHNLPFVEAINVF